MEDRNPAYEPANSGNQAINMNQIEDYDYMWNQDDYDNMGQRCGFKKCLYSYLLAFNFTL